MKRKNLVKKLGAAALALMLAGSTFTGAFAEESETLAAEQVLNLKFTDLSLLDVNDVRNANEFQVLTEVQEGLFRTFTEDGVEVVENAGCTSYEVSEDGLTYTFHLREESMWSDGVPVTAQHYVDSWLRLLNPDNAFSYAFLATGIEGAEAYYNGEGSEEDVAIKLIDDLTFEVTLAAPDSSFIKKVAMVCFYPVRKDLIDAAEEAGGDWTNDYTLHVFNGPFYISDRVRENSMTLKKNENYWDADSVILTQVNLQVVDETSTQAQLMESQQLDVLTLTDLEYVSMWESKVEDGTFVHISQDEPSVTYLVVDQHPAGEGGPSGLMLNEKCRLALSLAFDREEYALMFEEGLSTPAYSLVPYSMTVGDTEFRSVAEEPLLAYQEHIGDSEYLQALFKEGMEEAGFEGELSDVTLTVFTYSPNTKTTNILEWYKQQVENALGVNVNVEVYPDVSTWKTARDEYKYDFYTMGWNGDFNDPITFMELFVTGNGYAKFMGGFSDEEYDSLIEQARSSQDEAERLELFTQAEQLLLEKGGVIPLYFPQSQIYYQSYVKGLSLPLFGAEYEFSRAYIVEH
ncbi:MAG: peptide ABC transporter substrate-binding protein [Eubacteriales bacterium]|nr:peptide ABC transporter substrate-binding protein [Eubacteriales bacterium]